MDPLLVWNRVHTQNFFRVSWSKQRCKHLARNRTKIVGQKGAGIEEGGFHGFVPQPVWE